MVGGEAAATLMLGGGLGKAPHMKALVRGFERKIGQLYEDKCCLPEENINVAVVLDACCHVHSPQLVETNICPQVHLF